MSEYSLDTKLTLIRVSGMRVIVSETVKSVINTNSNLNEKVERRSLREIVRSVGAVGVTSAVLLSGSVASMELAAPAGADEQVFVGGNCDPNGAFVRQQAIEKGFYNPNARHPEIVYPASIAPICGNDTMRQSMNIGADQLMREYQNNAPGEHFFVESFSLGSGVADEFGNRITDRGRHPLPENVHLINNGDAYGAPGILNHPLAPIARVVTDFMGIPPASEIKPAPGTLIRFDINDFWGNGGAQGLDLGAVISMAARIPQDHRMPSPAEPHQTFVHKGVTYEVYGLENKDGISRAIIEAGGDPMDIGRWFFGILDGPQNPADMRRFNTPQQKATLARAQVAPAPPPAPRQMTRAELVDDLVEHVVPDFTPSVSVAPGSVVDNNFMKDLGLDGLMG